MSRLTEFIEKMEEQSCYHIPLCKENGICKEESCPISEAIEAIKELQHYKDLEEQGRLIEQKHGYWTGPDGYDCSECGENYMEVADADAYASGWKPNYCPNCGAKMEGSKW